MKTDKNLNVRVSEVARPILDSAAYVEGCCNGPICMASVRTREIILWNPWIRKSFVLPKITYPTNQEGCRTPSYGGFGYNDLTNDYKVVQFVNHNNFRGQLSTEVYVYGTKCNYWRKLPNFPYSIPGIHLLGRGSGLLASWALHWTVRERDALFIAAIDLRTEEYRLMPIPEALQSKLICLPYSFFGVVDGCLCVVPSLSDRDSPSSVWLMKDYGVKDSWTKLSVTVPWDGGVAADLILHPFGLSEEDKTLLTLLAFQRQEVFIVQYDIKNRILVEKLRKNVQDCLSEYAELPPIVKVYRWVPSIVWVPHSGEMKKDKKREGNCQVSCC